MEYTKIVDSDLLYSQIGEELDGCANQDAAYAAYYALRMVQEMIESLETEVEVVWDGPDADRHDCCDSCPPDPKPQKKYIKLISKYLKVMVAFKIGTVKEKVSFGKNSPKSNMPIPPIISAIHAMRTSPARLKRRDSTGKKILTATVPMELKA